MKRISAILTMCLAACFAQDRFVVPPPAAGAVTVERDVAYGDGIQLDLYLPAQAASQPAPVLIFLNTLGGGAVQRGWPIYKGWAQTAAAHGFGAILADTRDNRAEQDFQNLSAWIAAHGAEKRLDTNRVAVYAASANVYRALEFIENPKQTRVHAAAMFYGASDVSRFRLDLPVLFVRAGLDRPSTNQAMDTLTAAAIRANAPVTVLNHASGHHGFEVIDDTDASREVIERTLRFLQSALDPSYRASLRATSVEVEAAGAVLSGDFEKAAANYGSLLPSRPNDIRLLLSYGEALLGAKRYKEALAQFDRVKAIGGAGPRDLGIPAARAAALDHDTGRAIAWIESIPARFRPASLKDDPAFVSLRAEPAFQKLFEPSR